MGRPIQSPKDSQFLTVIDERTGEKFRIPIVDNAVDAAAFKKMKAKRAPGEREENETEGGLRVVDTGYSNTAVISSRITYIDGENGVLRYRGYPIEQLAEKSNFLETAYLLIYGDLPSNKQFRIFEKEVMHHTFVHNDLDKLVSSFRYDSHPMSILTSCFAALGSFAPEANPSLQGQNLYTNGAKGDKTALAAMDKQIYRLLGKSISLAAMAYRIRQGRHFNVPKPGLDYTETFLYLLDHLGEEDYKPNPVISKALDVLFILHADHEMNCSAASVLQVGSSLVDPYSAVAAGCAALYGPLHGGANEAVIRMLLDIGSPENVPAYIEKVKKKEKVLSGFGHRIYRTSDPRSFIIRKTAEEVFAVTGRNPLLETALTLHDIALKDDYFIQRRLYPNVDFFSGLIYQSLGFPTDYYPVLFAVPRVVGWLAHWRQLMLNPKGVKIWRPRQLYVGEGERDYVNMDTRKEVDPTPASSPTEVPHLFSKRAFLAEYKNKRNEERPNKL